MNVAFLRAVNVALIDFIMEYYDRFRPGAVDAAPSTASKEALLNIFPLSPEEAAELGRGKNPVLARSSGFEISHNRMWGERVDASYTITSQFASGIFSGASCPYRRLFSIEVMEDVASDPSSDVAVWYRAYIKHQLYPALQEVAKRTSFLLLLRDPHR
eukprot:SAG31_NODE_1813_length_7211_cov_9.203600_4_plen_158_part_00